MKNVIITTSLGSGGAERMLHRLMSSWKQPQSQIVFNMTKEGQFSSKLRDLGVKVYDLNLYRQPWNIFYLFRVLLLEEVSSIWGWMYHANVLALVARLLKPRAVLVWNIRHSLYHIEQEKRLTRIVIELNANFSGFPDKIIFNSTLSQSQHIQHGFKSDNTHYIPNGFELEMFPDMPQENHEFITIGHVGRFHPMKNQIELIKVFVDLARENEKLRFMLIGKGLEQSNQDLIKLIPPELLTKFAFMGEQTDVYRFYFQMDIFVLFSSWGEAFPNVLVEAILANNIAISSDVGDASSILGHKDFIVPIGDNVALKEMIIKFANLPSEERRDLNKSLKARVINDFF